MYKVHLIVHLICGAAEDEAEGYGQKVTCNVCQEHTTDGIKLVNVYVIYCIYLTYIKIRAVLEFAHYNIAQ